MPPTDAALLARVATGFGLGYIIGFERQLRGSAAGDRTFALVGLAAAAITGVAAPSAPAAIAGIVTGVGFIGAAVVFRGDAGRLHGVATAATILAVSALGIVVGFGHLIIGAASAVGVLFCLELPHLRWLQWLDARTYADRVANDPDIPVTERPTPSDGPTRPGPDHEGGE
jgi:putative Mg2+ transporter-C (MgtC) family protein